VRRRKEGRIAIVGGGLAGLSAAYHLPRTVRVTIFERDRAIGGRVRTASAFGAEEGAEFLLGSEHEIGRLTKELGVRCDEIQDWSSICFRGRWASG
jgi:protoporphyrinogen oxidase